MTEYPASLLRSLKGYLGVMVLFWGIGLSLVGIYGYEASFLLLNQWNTPYLDALMPHFTHVGDGLLIGGLLAFWVLRSDTSWVLCLLISLLGIFILVSISKEYLFNHWDRPAIVFSEGPAVHLISLGAERWKSFPSGHSAVAACVFLLFSFHLREKKIGVGILLGALAVSVCYSRLYIGVHFLADIVAGSMVGALVALAVLSTCYRPFSNYIFSLTEKTQQRIRHALYILLAVSWLVSVGVIINYYV